MEINASELFNFIVVAVIFPGALYVIFKLRKLKSEIHNQSKYAGFSNLRNSSEVIVKGGINTDKINAFNRRQKNRMSQKQKKLLSSIEHS